MVVGAPYRPSTTQGDTWPSHLAAVFTPVVGRTIAFTTVIHGLRPAKLDENESRPLRVFNGLAHVFDPESGLSRPHVLRPGAENQ